MQDKIQNISPIKQRILQFIDYIGISKRQFYLLTGISRGTLESHTGISEPTVEKLIACYPDLNKNWIITGEGSMLKRIYQPPDSIHNKVEEEKIKYDISKSNHDEDRFIISQLNNIIENQKDIIRFLQEELTIYRKNKE